MKSIFYSVSILIAVSLFTSPPWFIIEYTVAVTQSKISAAIEGSNHVQFDRPLFQIVWLGESDAIASRWHQRSAESSRVVPNIGNVNRLRELGGANPFLPGVRSYSLTKNKNTKNVPWISPRPLDSPWRWRNAN